MRKSSAGKAADGGRLGGVFGDLLVHRFSVRQPEVFRVIQRVAKQRLASLNQAALCELAQTVIDLDFDSIDGEFLQVGCKTKGVAMVIERAKRSSRTFTAYDSFPEGMEAGACALIHVDFDEYDPMHLSLAHFVPKLVRGGHLIIEGYRNREQCRKAVDDYFRNKKGFQFFRQSLLHVIRN